MSASTSRDQPRRRYEGKRGTVPQELPPIMCPRCGGPILPGQIVPPLFAAKLTTWAEHPVLSKPVAINGIVSADGSSRSDLTVHEQLEQRAAMGGERERAQLKAFEELLVKTITKSMVRQLREEAAAHGVDVWTWLNEGQQEGNT